MSYNVEWLYKGKTSAHLVVEQIARAPVDVIGLQEVSDSNGPAYYGFPETQGAVNSANETLQELSDEIFDATGVRYAWIDGEPDYSASYFGGRNIRNAFLYRVNGDNPISYAGEGLPPYSTADASMPGYRLPNPNLAIADASRPWKPPLVATFRKGAMGASSGAYQCGRSFTVVSLHLKSGSSGEAQRVQEAEYVANQTSLLVEAGVDDVAVLGDFNDIQGSVKPVFDSIGFVNLWSLNTYRSTEGVVTENRPNGPYTVSSASYDSGLDNIYVPSWSRSRVIPDLLWLRHPSERFHAPDHQPLVAEIEFATRLGCSTIKQDYSELKCCGRSKGNK
jgi:endonuclease/exonuclease/phosphatase family metal-dependent hydrolase